MENGPFKYIPYMEGDKVLNRKSVERHYKSYTYSETADVSILERYMKERTKRLGYSYREGGESTSVLISGAHANGMIEVVGEKVDGIRVEELNQSSPYSVDRYEVGPDNNLLLGKTYHGAAERGAIDFRADSNVGVMNIELQAEVEREIEAKRVPHVINYEMPQIYPEPNRVEDTVSPIISYKTLEDSGMIKLAKYIREFSLESITEDDIIALRRGQYSGLNIDSSQEEEGFKAKLTAFEEANTAIKALLDDIKEGKDGAVERYKILEATLGTIKIHRGFYAEQSRLLYENGLKYPVNLEIHTCFDRIEEGVDVIIGSNHGRSVMDPETELLLSMVLNKQGIKANLSTLTTFPGGDTKQLERQATSDFLEGVSGLLKDDEKVEFDRLKSIEDDPALVNEINSIVEERIRILGDKEKGILTAYLKKKVKLPDDQVDQMSLDEIRKKAFNNYIESVKTMNMFNEEKKVFLLQNYVNAKVGGDYHYDHLRGGLTGLSSLNSKFNARNNYKTLDGGEFRPAIMQVEIAKNIMLDSGKRAKVQEALKDFISIVQAQDFDPKTAFLDYKLS